VLKFVQNMPFKKNQFIYNSFYNFKMPIPLAAPISVTTHKNVTFPNISCISSSSMQMLLPWQAR
jgi:hypothetical protein